MSKEGDNVVFDFNDDEEGEFSPDEFVDAETNPVVKLFTFFYNF